MTQIPDDPREFENLMAQIDHDLGSDGLAIPQRPLHALRLISMRFGIPMPVTPPIPGITNEAHKYWPVSDRIYKWYDRRYGDRLKMDFGPGRMATLIDHDVWVFRFPRIYGSARLVASKTIKSDRKRTDGNPVIFNILDSMDDLPEALRASLTDAQLSTLLKDFVLGFVTLSTLNTVAGEDLIRAALADISATVDQLSGRNPEYGFAKWSSLQAAEKLIKAAIKRSGGKFSMTHNLEQILKEAKQLGLAFDIDETISKIQCTPAIRYGQEPCRKDEAISAHHAVFEVAKRVSEILEYRRD